MPDFTDLLKHAAGVPPTPLNMHAVRRRAARLGYRRWRLRLAGFIALVGVGGPTGSVLLPASDRPTHVETDRDQRQPEEIDADRPPDQDGSAQPGAGLSGVEGSPIAPGAGGSGTSSRRTPVAASNDRIAYTVGTNLYVADLDGTNAQHLVGDARSVPSWAPDGNRIAYVAEIEAGDADAVHCDYDGPPFGSQCPGDWGVTVVNSDGSAKRLIAGGEHPAWSPDGNWIAFVADGISVIRPDGTGERQLLITPGNAMHLDWSPDGTRIAFSMRGTTATCVPTAVCDGHVYVVDADGSNLRQVTFEDGEQFDPSWSPDGRRIVFAASPIGDVSPPDAVIYTVRPDGTGLTKITDNPVGTSGRRQGRDSSPDWTPDFRIVWVQDPGDPGNADGSGTAEVYMMNSDGSGQARLFSGQRPAVAPRRA